ncbi:MAG: DUF2914 domain-containing protein [Desulfobacteraceae bacterium]|nr:DUF2914 domain-containing protein [Desulfobacteraceae bacterium]
MNMIFPEKSNKILLPSLVVFIVAFLFFTTNVSSEPSSANMVQAVMCESIENFQPLNPGVVFSISLGEVYCFSNFDPVVKKTYIFHKWYKKDKLIFTMRLTLSPPKWSSFSRIQLRDADKGPWRVEILDADDTLLKILRFSMVD